MQVVWRQTTAGRQGWCPTIVVHLKKIASLSNTFLGQNCLDGKAYIFFVQIFNNEQIAFCLDKKSNKKIKSLNKKG